MREERLLTKTQQQDQLVAVSATVKLSTQDERELWRAAYVAAVRAGLVSPDGNGGAGAKLADAAVEQYRQRTREERPR